MHAEAPQLDAQAIMRREGGVVKLSPWEEAVAWAKEEMRVKTPPPETGEPQRMREAPIRWKVLKTLPRPKRDWLVRGLLEPQKFAAVIGQPKAAKTWWEIEMAISIATGSSCAGYADMQCEKRGPVFLFAAEDELSNVQDRINALVRARGDEFTEEDHAYLDENLVVLPAQRVDLMSDSQFIAFNAEIRMAQQEPACIFIDPFVDVLNLESENDSREMANGVERFRIMRDMHKCAVVVVHHAKKSNSSGKMVDVESARGSNVFMGKLDAWVTLSKVEKTADVVESDFHVTLKKGRASEPMRLKLQLTDDSDGHAIRGEWTLTRKDVTAAAKVDAMEQKVLDVLTSEPRGVERIAALAGVHEKTARRHLQALKVKGMANNDPRFGWTRVAKAGA